jgi:hypothetical protein
MNINSLVGEVLTHVDEFDDEILLTCQSGRKIKIFHSQDCCESVGIVDMEGNWKDLIGKIIVDASEEIVDSDNCNIDDLGIAHSESWTRTNVVFRVDGATVISKWVGDSNGYYSESVDFAEIEGPNVKQ